MNRYLFYRRIRGPVFLLTFGATALLAQWDVLSFSKSWPLYLIVLGVLRLAEGAAFATATPLPPLYPAQSYSAAPYPPYSGPANPGPTVPGTGLVPLSPAPIQTAGHAAGYEPVPERES